MTNFKGGINEAAKILRGLGSSQSAKLLEQIRKKNPQMAQQLEMQMVQMEDLQYCSAAQLVGLLRDVNLEKFGLALRTVDKKIVAKLMAMVSTGIRLDIEDGLKGPPRNIVEVEAAQTYIQQIMRKKIDQGQLTLSSENLDSDELV